MAILAERKFIGSGIECCVYDMQDGRVYKDFDRLMYLDYGEKLKYAAISYELHCIAAEHGLAPAVYELDGTGYYCEKVACIEDFSRDGLWELADQKVELLDKISEIFDGDMFDKHIGNFGVLPDGRLCVIDFGCVGFSRTEVCRELREKYGLERY